MFLLEIVFKCLNAYIIFFNKFVTMATMKKDVTIAVVIAI